MRAGDGLPSNDCGGARTSPSALHITVFTRWLLLLTLLLPGPAIAAGFTCSRQVESALASGSRFDELEEVVINGSKPTSRTKDLGAWLRLLEGQYSYEGYVDLCGNGNAAEQRPVTGKADCVSLYETSTEPLLSLYCVVDVRWPQAQGENSTPVMGSEPSRSPAMVIYGVVPDLPGIQFMQIDNQGIATHAHGKLTGDTLTATESCELPGFCRKVTRITAIPGKDIAMLVDFEIDSRRVLRHAFLLHRVSNIQLSRGPHNVMAVGGELASVGER